MRLKTFIFIVFNELFLIITALDFSVPSFTNQTTFFDVDILKNEKNVIRTCGLGSFLISIRLNPKMKSYLGENPGDASITVCIDPKLHSTNWASHLIEPMGEWDIPEEWKDKFLTEPELAGKKIEDLYSQNEIYEKGLLAPKADFNRHGLHKEMVFHYVNAVPQYKILQTDEGNWKALEAGLRELATRTKSKVYVLTGTLGSIGLLDLDEKYPKVNIPEKLYKVVHYCFNRVVHSVVFIADNSPKSAPPACSDQCKKLLKNFDEKMRTKLENPLLGQMYCCELNDFMEKVLPMVPGGAKSVHIMHPEHYSHLVVCGYESQRFLK